MRKGGGERKGGVSSVRTTVVEIRYISSLKSDVRLIAMAVCLLVITTVVGLHISCCLLHGTTHMDGCVVSVQSDLSVYRIYKDPHEIGRLGYILRTVLGSPSP